MYKVLHKDTIKSKPPPPLSLAKRDYASNHDRTENFQYLSLQAENLLPMACYLHVSMILPPLMCAACSATARTGGCKRTRYLWPLPTCVHATPSVLSSFRQKFNTKRALFLHLSPTLPQKIDSREGWFWCKRGTIVNAGKMNIYFKEPQFALDFRLFGAKHTAFCR